GAAALDQDALWYELDFHLAGGDLLLAGGRRAGAHRERRDQLLHLVVLGQDLTAGRAGVAERVAHERQGFRVLIAERADQRRREPMGDAEPGNGDRRAVGYVPDGLLGRGNDLVHGVPQLSGMVTVCFARAYQDRGRSVMAARTRPRGRPSSSGAR